MDGIDTTGLQQVLTDLGTASTPLIVAAIGVSASIFGLTFLWRKAKGAIG